MVIKKSPVSISILNNYREKYSLSMFFVVLIPFTISVQFLDIFVTKYIEGKTTKEKLPLNNNYWLNKYSLYLIRCLNVNFVMKNTPYFEEE